MLFSIQQQTDPTHVYEQYVKNGKLSDDEAQRRVVEHLQELYDELTSQEKRGWFTRLFKKPENPRSIYIWGDVGRGKSLLMDTFFDTVPLDKKKRIHFHALMIKVHAQIHAFRKIEDDTPLESAAKEISEKIELLCLDEFQVTDVADAMILSKLFTTLLEDNVTFVITSNRKPEDLYLGGLQREKFLDFVKLIYERMEVVELASPFDYRMKQIQAMQSVYLCPLNAENEAILQKSFAQLIHSREPESQVIEVQGRELKVRESYGGIAKFTFAELCEKPLGAADYLAIAQIFHTVLLSGIPELSPEKRNEARRFVTFIDTIYDHNVKLICTAAASPDKLYAKGDGKFEFERTISRLNEMQSEQYLKRGHV